MNRRASFYKETLAAWIPHQEASILVVGGGSTDRDVLLACGFHHVVISNLDARLQGNEFAPFRWSFQDAERLTYPDNHFDYVVVHAALHHCSSPHRALQEMYRVARYGLVALESRDSFLMRLVEALGLTLSYEHSAVFFNGCKFGGVNNTAIPNHVYRWTEREIEKSVRSYDPTGVQSFSYRYGYDLPSVVDLESGSRLKPVAVRALTPFYRLFAFLLPKQQNLFAFMVRKPAIPEDLHPWLRVQEGGIGFNEDWGRRRYKDAPNSSGQQ
ncbi:MAG: class I SAM-dependent methyltransferase [Longimicrobiaceae bacterium]